jgi:hypothetical protein
MRAQGQTHDGPRAWLGAGAVLLAAGIVAAGCGQGRDTQITTTGKPLTAVALAAAATRTDTAGTASFHFTMGMSGSALDSPVTMTGDGSFDPSTHLSEGDLDMSAYSSLLSGRVADSPAGSAKMHEVTDGTTEYIQWGLLNAMLPAGKTWAKMDLSSVATSSEMNSMTADGSSYLTVLEGISGGATRVGTEQVDGQATTHYRAQIDVAKVLARLPKNLPSSVESLYKKMGSGNFPVDVWVGSDGYVHRLALKMDLGQLSGQAVDMSMTLTETLSDFGQPVSITVPPPDQVAALPGLASLSH